MNVVVFSAVCLAMCASSQRLAACVLQSPPYGENEALRDNSLVDLSLCDVIFTTVVRSRESFISAFKKRENVSRWFLPLRLTRLLQCFHPRALSARSITLGFFICTLFFAPSAYSYLPRPPASQLSADGLCFPVLCVCTVFSVFFSSDFEFAHILLCQRLVLIYKFINEIRERERDR